MMKDYKDMIYSVHPCQRPQHGFSMHYAEVGCKSDMALSDLVSKIRSVPRVPNPGAHYVRYQGKLIVYDRDRDALVIAREIEQSRDTGLLARFKDSRAIRRYDLPVQEIFHWNRH